MKVGKEIIKFGVNQLMLFYPEFCKHVQYVGDEKIVNGWYNMFKSMEYDYDLAEQDFKKAINEIIRFENKAPTFSDILNTMREYKKRHDLEIISEKVERARNE